MDIYAKGIHIEGATWLGVRGWRLKAIKWENGMQQQQQLRTQKECDTIECRRRL